MEIARFYKGRSIILTSTALLMLSVLLISSFYGVFAIKPPAVPVFLDPTTIPKYVNQLVVPPVYQPDAGTTNYYTVKMVTATQQILPTGTVLPGGGTGLTTVWGYQGNAIAKGGTLGVADGTILPNFVFSPSATFEAVKGVPITVNWVNEIDVMQPFAVDPTLYWANPWKPNLATDWNPTNPNADLAKAFTDGDIFGQPPRNHPPFNTLVLPYTFGYDGTTTALNPTGLDAQWPVALVPHLHGAEVQSNFDGGPEAWWTSAATNLRGPHYSTAGGTAPAGTAEYYYPNAQEPNTLWYHDHALGITRINVMSGLAGFYLLRNETSTVVTTPTTATLDTYLTQTFQYGVSEIPIAIQDRTFKANGELWFPEAGINPTIHPYWSPEFFGDTIMVNGRVWPNLDVTQGWYRFRLLNGSNARFYTISLKEQLTGAKLPFIVIGSDGGYLMAPVTLNELTIAPGERADILVDFSALTVGNTVLVTNKAKSPYPNGAQPKPQTTGQIMQFTVKAAGTTTHGTEGVPTATFAGLNTLPTTGLNPTLPLGAFPTITAPPPANQRFITLNEVMGALGPTMAVINGQHYFGTATETPTVGTTEDWVIINLTGDTHPIHLHLVTFQLVSRQKVDVAKYLAAWLALQTDPNTQLPLTPPFPEWYVPTALDPTPYLKSKAAVAPPTETGWKDTIQMNPGEVTIIRVRFTSQDGAPIDGTAGSAFDARVGPGYVWHCHIIDHEDNEMMRPLIVN